jgi:formate hydrogenlyase transcriptional activator
MKVTSTERLRTWSFIALTDMCFAISCATAKSASHESLQEMLEETEWNQILRALEEANGVVGGPNGAAARLGVKRSTVQLRMQKLGIRLSRTAVDERRQTAR